MLAIILSNAKLSGWRIKGETPAVSSAEYHLPALCDAGLNCSVAFYVVMLPIFYVVLPEMYCVWIAVDTECQVLPEKHSFS